MSSEKISHCSFMNFFQLFLNLQCSKFLPRNLELVQLKKGLPNIGHVKANNEQKKAAILNFIDSK